MRHSWDGTSTTRQLPGGATRLYLHLFSWPENGELTVRGLNSRPRSAQLLGTGETVEVHGGPDAWQFTLPNPGDTPPLIPILELSFAEIPQMEVPVHTAGPDGTLRLTALDAALAGTSVSWKIRLAPGKYRLAIDGSCAGGDAPLSVRFHGAESREVFPRTEAWNVFRLTPCGVLTVPEHQADGDLVIQVLPRPAGAMASAVSFRSVHLTPETKARSQPVP